MNQRKQYYLSWEIYLEASGSETYTIHTLDGGTLAYIRQNSSNSWYWAIFDQGAGSCATLQMAMHEVETLITKNGWALTTEKLRAMA